jgi:hypothetical protein
MFLGGCITLVQSTNNPETYTAVNVQETLPISEAADPPTKSPTSFMEQNNVSALSGITLIAIWFIVLVGGAVLRFGKIVPGQGLVALFELFYRCALHAVCAAQIHGAVVVSQDFQLNAGRVRLFMEEGRLLFLFSCLK